MNTYEYSNIREALAKYYSIIGKIITSQSEDKDSSLEAFGEEIILRNRNVRRQMDELNKSEEVEFLKDLDFSTLTLPFLEDFILKYQPSSVLGTLPIYTESNAGTNERGESPSRKDLTTEDYHKKEKSKLMQMPIKGEPSKAITPALITNSISKDGIEVRQEENKSPKDKYQIPIKVTGLYQVKNPEQKEIEMGNNVIEKLWN